MPDPSAAAEPSFAVTWEQPEDAALFWAIDRMHFPDPATPLSCDLPIGDGFNRAAEAYGLPVRWRVRRMFAHRYQAMAPVSRDPAVLGQAGAESARRLGEAATGLATLWRETWRPELVALHHWWDAFDLAGADRAALAAHLEASLERFVRLWELHFQIVMPAHPAMGAFEDLYHELFPEAPETEALTLLEQARHANAAADLALWRLGRQALEIPAVAAILAAAPLTEIGAALRREPAAAAWLGALDTFLEAYGQRADALDIAAAPWVEDPTPVFAALVEHARRPDWDLEAEYAGRARAREASLAAARGRLEGYPAPVVDRFETLLAQGEEAAYLAEEHNFWIDQRGLYRMRRVLVEVGRRLAAAGVLAHPHDVFFLTLAELRGDIAAQAPASRQAVVAQRRAEMAHYAAHRPPVTFGTPPPSRPGAKPDRFFGGPPPASDDPAVLTGAGASPGVASGRVRVIERAEEGLALLPGEVLVCTTTLVSWTPLFARAAAVVTDTGGVLSHAAVVAREYGVPAVVGTGFGTQRLNDGMLVEVDGGAGRVRILAQA